MNLEIVKEKDICMATSSFIEGYCILFQNEYIKRLYQYQDYYKFIFNSPIHHTLDEKNF